MKNGTLYGIGVGPGDPELLTLKAVKTIQKCSVIAVPDTGKSENLALKIIQEYTQGKEILKCYMPMTRDQEVLRREHENVRTQLCEILMERDVCFVTLGDPTIYSTYIYLHQEITDRGFSTKIIPGIPSFCAAAAALNISLCEGDESLHILPGGSDGFEERMQCSGTKIIMKPGRHLKLIQNYLKDQNLLSGSRMIEKCSMEDEKIWVDLLEADESASYFSTIIVKES